MKIPDELQNEDKNGGIVNKELKKIYKPSKEYSSEAVIKSMEEYRDIHKESVLNPENFWGQIADEIDWFKYWSIIRQGSQFESKWFVGAKTNIAHNCLDRHLAGWRRNKAAIIWEGEPGDSRIMTYQTLHREVCRFSNVLKKLGVEKGDRVVVYMGMIPETAVTLLACARIGAVHTVVFAGLSAEALKERINDASAKLVVVSDLAYRRGTQVLLKPAVDTALEDCPSVKSVVVFKRDADSKVHMLLGRDHWWHEVIQSANDDCPAAQLDSEHPLFLFYTSGTTGKPKGILHTTAGYMMAAYYTSKVVFNVTDEDVYWCTADIGFSTGHTYGIYGPLLNGATMVMYEGALNQPEPDRVWKIIDKYKVSVFYTAPTFIRSFMKWGEQWVLKNDLSSLKLIALGGEPANSHVWYWVHKIIGKEKCPVIEVYWQAETGAIMISPLPGATPVKPGSCCLPMPGVIADVVNKNGEPVAAGEIGYLVLKDSWPSMVRTIYGDSKRYKKDYWNEFKGDFFTGDGAKKDKDGYFWILGRIDDVITVSGHRLGTAELENALASHPAVSEAAVVARPDEIKGNAIVAFVCLHSDHTPSMLLKEELRDHVTKEISHIARPDEIRFTEALPKTKNGKIVRRLLREIASNGMVISDVSAIEDYELLEKLRDDL